DHMGIEETARADAVFLHQPLLGFRIIEPEDAQLVGEAAGAGALPFAKRDILERILDDARNGRFRRVAPSLLVDDAHIARLVFLPKVVQELPFAGILIRPSPYPTTSRP
ncbi:hypothetical protein ACE04B_29610, partial [Rhizobium phaseoli]